MTGSPENPEVVNSVDTPAEELTRNEQVSHYIDLYKQSVSVQMHFNDIEWRIRGLALTVATFSLGAAGVAAKDGTQVGRVSLGTVVLAIGLLLWYAFYFVDKVWYHPLLKAAVDNGTAIEKKISESLPHANMTATITANSGYQTKRVVGFLSRKDSMRSADKLVWFYKIGATALALAAIALQVGAMLGTSPAKGNPTPAPTPSASATSDPPRDMQK